MSSNVVQLRDVPSVEDQVAPEEWLARVDLAAGYRLAHHHGWAGSIYNHISMRVPGEPDHMLIKAHELLYDEVTASNLVKVDMRRDEVDESWHVNRPGFTLHGGVLADRPDTNSVFHQHIAACVAVANQPGGLLPVSQAAMQFYQNIGYHDYEGITEDLDERARIAAALGDANALLMRNHGVTTLGRTVRDGYVRMRELAEACELQLAMQAAGTDYVLPSEAVLERYVEQRKSHDAGRGSADWPAMLRRLDRLDSTYKA